MSDAPPRLPFVIDEQLDPSLITAHAGVPVLIELFRTVGAAQAVDDHVRLKQRQRGLPASQVVESLVALWAAGGRPRPGPGDAANRCGVGGPVGL